MPTPWRSMAVPAGLTLEQHAVAAQHLVGEFLAECADAELRLTSRPRLTIKAAKPYEVDLPDGSTFLVPAVNRWTVEADAADE